MFEIQPLTHALKKHRRRLVRLTVALVVAPIALVLVMAVFTPLPEELREPAAPSVRVTARNGSLLREVRASDGARARPLPLAAFPPHARNAVLAAEDRHFYAHFGVDLLAVVRAAASNIVHWRIVSGASTITMQLARTLRPHPRSLWGKMREVSLALRIEASLSKDQILEEYLNRVTYGPSVRGYAAASHAYLGTPPELLSVGGAALIAGLPRGPSLYDVSRRPHLAKRRRDRVLARMVEAGMIDTKQMENAIAEPIAPQVTRPALGAPHFVRGVLGEGAIVALQPGLADMLADRRDLSEITSTIEPEIQRSAETAVTSTLATLVEKHVTAASAIVLDNATGEVLAWVGSPDFDNAISLGQNDGVIAHRQPGSSLKPFIYAEAMTSLGYTGATLLPDVELHLPLPGGGDYVPHDYDGKLRGPVRLREALGNSLNIPAVYTIQQIGTQKALDRLHAMGFASLTEDAEHYGPALALGDGEVTLVELANAYATLARGGVRRDVRLVSRVMRGDNPIDVPMSDATVRAVDERVATLVTDILADRSARVASFGDDNVLEADFEVAAKTGTSKGYRDNVAVGYTRELTVAVWVGNFDGSPMANVSGITGAGPIFRSVMTAAVQVRTPERRQRAPLAIGSLSRDDRTRLDLARIAVCPLSGEIPTSACPHRINEWLRDGDDEHAPPCTVHEHVRIDRRNGLRAGVGCSSDMTESRVFERWPAPFDTWAKSTGRPLAPASSPACPADSESMGLPRIVYPFEGQRFVIDPEQPADMQRLELRIEPDGPDVELRIDDVLLKGRSWPIVAGSHSAIASRGDARGPAVHFSVR